MDRTPDAAAGGGSYSERDTFARIAEHFERCRSAPADDRERRLAALDVDDPAVAAEVRRLLRHHETSDVLDQPEAALDRDEVAAALDQTVATVPERLGPWRLLRVIGRGGMGTVHLAERADGEFERQVAIKLLRASAHDDDLVQRFRAERRILAALTHPNIASLLDGGTTADGRPYVVMEYVEGTDLVSYAQRQGLTVPQRVGLFLEVCAAVSHAHRALVVHRDLKPSNILVAADGRPKLLDFGIAKLLASDEREDLALTGAGTMLLTPEYASPEQVRGEAVTTATDVYASGLVLYELLTGRRAQQLTTRALRELEQVVCDTEPSLPSTVVAARVQRQLRGDLDNIIATAMHKDPARRYPSAEALADDLQRYLDGLPVRARRDTWAYRCRKFVRRNPGGIAAAAGILLLLIYGVVSTFRHARQVAQERDAAVRESTISKEIGDFLVGLYEMAEPDAARAEQLRARHLLDRGSRRIRHELGAGPLVRAGLMEAMGRSYLGLGLNDEAGDLIEESDRLRRESGAGADALARSRLTLARLRISQGRYPEGEAMLIEALAMRRASARAPDAGAAEILMHLGDVLREVGRFDEALVHIGEAERTLLAVHGEQDQTYVEALILHAMIDRDRSEYDQALTLLDRVAGLQVQVFGPDHPAQAKTLRELCAVHKELGHYDEARAAIDKALAFDRQIGGEDHPDVDTDLFVQAMLESDLGDPDRALELMNEVLERDRQRFGEHAYVALDLGQVASLRSRRGEFEVAEKLFDEALAMQRRLLPPGHPEIATTLDNMGGNYGRLRRYERGLECLREALELRQAALPPDHPSVLTSRSKVAVQLHNMGRAAEAEQEYRAVLEVRRRKFPVHPDTAGSLYRVACAVRDQDRLAEARTLAEESLAMYRATLPSGHLDIARPARLVGILMARSGEAAAAEPLLREAAQSRRRQLLPDHYEVVSVERELAECLAALERFAEGEASLLQAIERCGTAGDRSGNGVAQLRVTLAELYDAWGKPDAAASVRALR